MDEQTIYMIIALFGIILVFSIFNHFTEHKKIHPRDQALIDVKETNKQIVEQLNGRLAAFDEEYLNFIFEKISSEPEKSEMYTQQYNDLKEYRHRWAKLVHKQCYDDESIVLYARSL